MVNNTSAPLFTLDVTGSQRISNADGSMIFSNGNLTASNASGSMIFSNGNLTASNASGSLSLVGNKVGINTTPTTYSLEVAGTQQINDGTGTLTFSNGIQKSSGGFNSITGTVSAFTNTIIGEWRRGIVMVSAQDTFTHIYYTFNIFGVSVSGTNFAVVLISGSSNGMSITQSSSNIVLLNSQGLGMMEYHVLPNALSFSTIFLILTEETPEASETLVSCPPKTAQTTPATIVFGVCSISGNVCSLRTIASRSESDKSMSAQIRSAIPNCVFNTLDPSSENRVKALQRERMETWNRFATSSCERVALC
jgi:hypothetical protein